MFLIKETSLNVLCREAGHNTEGALWKYPSLFPYTDAGRTGLVLKLQLLLWKALQTFRRKWLYKRTAPNRRLHVLLCRLPFRWSLGIDRFLYNSIRLLGNKKSNQIIVLDVGKFQQYDKKFFENRALYKFEDGEFWGVRDYDEYLRMIYGDYMTPNKWGHIEDYSAVVV